MARTPTARKSSPVRRQGRRVIPAVWRVARRMKASVKPSKRALKHSLQKRSLPKGEPLTLGELISAAFDTAGGELVEVLRVVTSPQLSKALGRRIVLEA